MAAPPMRRAPPADWKTWNIIYPCYVDSSKKTSEGRKIALSKCKGCDSPNTADIAEALVGAGFPPETILLENMKRHPRDFFAEGRVRVKIRNEDGTPTVPAVPTKMKALEAIGKFIPTLPARPLRQDRMKEHEAAMKANIMSMFSGKRPALPAGARPPLGRGGAGAGAAAAAVAGGAPQSGAGAGGATDGKKKKSTKGKVVKRKAKR